MLEILQKFNHVMLLIRMEFHKLFISVSYQINLPIFSLRVYCLYTLQKFCQKQLITWKLIKIRKTIFDRKTENRSANSFMPACCSLRSHFVLSKPTVFIMIRKRNKDALRNACLLWS